MAIGRLGDIINIMKLAPIPENEKERLLALRRLKILDTKPDKRLDLLTKTAVKRFDVPISTISIIDEEREWFKSCQGLPKKEGDRAISFCGHAMLAKNIFIVEDTLKDERFADNPYVVGPPYLRFYAGVAIYEHKSGQPIGVFCIKDTEPRTMSPEDISFLINLAEKAEDILNGEA
ncbi:MAG: GGDEF domain containing protein [Candidatus Azambacteria bacterium GW2011_GWC2_45_7b]|uniref:GGDEF domain containing protein n=3 Tax=Parcubacteria group TaxID=1794811 RepID=A0A837IJ74_9BACT|nr:MAG: Sensor protein [Parcubacteria group bacterium GW2011_GWC1_44_10]KKT60054.1 MAG: GGDEF domain containing protein [Candidatus Giovannonibacteria bacterium GW2011_GWA1_44_25]KKU12904.1 MAG: GGDEF domain containing protein [Candidatus Azambacteria bacterium GW2011_GWC2_45_7b]KKU30172.1 MAG: GGDEF domain containing protein [Candidatus Giovannonibacteria bacterium GW2011_GWB1_46_20]